MDAQTILADLREQFGRKKVLYSEDMAELLGKSEQALANLKHRGGLPLPIKMVGGRPAASIYDVADWLASDESPGKPQKAGKATPLPLPKRRRESLGKAILALQVQLQFLAELHARMEAIALKPPADIDGQPPNTPSV